MNHERASVVAEAINGCQSVAAGDDATSQNYGSDMFTVTRRGVEWTHTGECVHLDEFNFAPARVHQAGEIETEQAPRQPVFEVVLQAINIPGSHVYIPHDIVYESAKHNCLIRVLDDGSLRLRNDLQGVSAPGSAALE